MGKVKENNRHEWHAVICACCSKRETIRVLLGKLHEDARFTERHEYLCAVCIKRHNPSLGEYREAGRGQKWRQATPPKPLKLKDQLRGSK
jgi:hypothetical protein